MKKLLTAFFVLGLVTNGYSQFKVQAGATVTFNGSATLVLQDTDFINEGTVNAGTSTISFTGTGANAIESGGASLYNVEVNKSSGADLNLTDDMIVTNQLSFSGNNNKVNLVNSDLTLGSSATIAGADDQDFMVTGGTGEVIKESLGTFTFPVGFSGSTYNPITIVESGTADNIGVRVMENALAMGSSGAALTNGVNASWEVTEATAGGSDLALTSEWAASDEDGTFDRTDSGIARYDSGTDWDLSPSDMGAAAGGDPYTRMASGYEPGIFTVSGEALMNTLLLDVSIQLQGAFDGGLMDDDLRQASYLPSATPYGAGRFINEGRGGGEVATGTAFDANGNNSVVDWVFIYLKDDSNPNTTLQTKSALVQRDGDIVDLDGVSSLEIPGDPGDYHIAIGHRNHLNIRSASAITGINETSATAYDFSSGSGQAFGTDAMADLGSGVFGMWGGNAKNDDNYVRVKPRIFPPPALASDVTFILDNALGSDPNATVTGYHDSDVNMDGFVRVKPRIFPPPALSSDATFILDEVLNSDPNATKTEQF